jgi:hypothetical protein
MLRSLQFPKEANEACSFLQEHACHRSWSCSPENIDRLLEFRDGPCAFLPAGSTQNLSLQSHPALFLPQVMADRAILVPEAVPPAKNEAPTLWSLTWQHPIFRFLDPHFQQDLFPPPKPALAPPVTEESSSGQEKPVEESPDAPSSDTAGASDEGAGGSPSAGTVDEGREGSSPADSKDVADGGVKAEEVDVAEGYEKVEMEMVEPGK